MIGLVTVLIGFLVNDVVSSVKKIEVEHITGNERLKELETRNEDIIRRLDRIEKKLDNVL